MLKRSAKVTLALGGAAALGIYMATREPDCKPPDPDGWNTPDNAQPCRSSRSSGRGGRWGWSGGSSYSSSSNTSTATASKTSSSSAQGVVSRGGFGATGSAISGHGGS